MFANAILKPQKTEDVFMACFLVPTGEAIIVSAAQLILHRHEKKMALASRDNSHEAMSKIKTATWSEKLGWLNGMLWGGAFLLALEHIWHGEVRAYWPFLTAMDSAQDTAGMLHEMLTVGVTMALVVTAAWGVMVLLYWQLVEKKANAPELKKAAK